MTAQDRARTAFTRLPQIAKGGRAVVLGSALPSGKVVPILVGGWLLWAVAISWPLVQIHLDWLETSTLRTSAFVALGATPVLLFVWIRLRRLGADRFEPFILASLALVPPMIHAPWGLLTVAASVACASAAAFRLLARWGLGAGRAAPLIAAILGQALLISIYMALGIAGLLSAWSVGITWTLLGWYGRRTLIELPAGFRRQWRAWAADPTLREAWGGISFAAAAGAIMLGGVVGIAPSTHFDSISFHLPLARHYAETGGLAPLRLVDYSYFPQGYELLLAGLWTLGGQPAAQLLSAVSLALAAAAAYSILRALRAQRSRALLGVSLALTIPVVHWAGSVVKNDLLAAAFTLAALHACLRADQSPADLVPRRLGLAAFLLGASLAVKHTAFFGVVAVAGPSLYVFARRVRRSRLQVSTALLALVLLGAGPWYLRTYLLTGNPTHPYDVRIAAGFLGIDVNEQSGKRQYVEYWRIPQVTHFQGNLVWELRSANPLAFGLLLFAPVWLLHWGAVGRSRLLVGGFLTLYFLYWGASWPVLRYALPFVIVFFAWTVVKMGGIRQRGGPIARIAIDAAMVYVLMTGGLITSLTEIHQPHLELAAVRLSEQEFLEKSLGTWSPIRYLRDQARPGDRVLSINNCARSYAPNVRTFDCYMMGSPQLRAEAVPRLIGAQPYQFLLAPAVSEPWLDEVRSSRRWRLRFQDADWQVFEAQTVATD